MSSINIIIKKHLARALCVVLVFVFCAFIFLLNVQSMQAQSSGEAAIWRGYKHKWTYNHRINRIGSFVDNDADEMIYTSASGFGEDSTFYTSGYSRLESDEIHFKYGKVSLDIEGKEGDLIVKNATIELPFSEKEIQENQFYTVLNGYDILSIDKADKLNYLQIKVDEASYSDEGVKFDVSTSIIANCHSVECAVLNKKMHYKIDVYYMLIYGKQDFLNSKNCSYSKDYDWDKKVEVVNQPETIQVKLQSGKYEEAAIGIKSFAIYFDDDHWFLEWNNFAELIDYKKETGMLRFSLDYYYKCWSEAMKEKADYSKHKKYSVKSKGHASLNISLAVFQFNNTKVQQVNESGRMFWKGKNITSDSPFAMDRKKISFE